MLRTAKLCGMKGLQTAKIVGLGDYVDLTDCVGTDAFVRPAAQMYRAAGFHSMLQRRRLIHLLAASDPLINRLAPSEPLAGAVPVGNRFFTQLPT